MINIDVHQHIMASCEDICAVLLDHEQLPRFFDAKIALAKPENAGEIVGGIGSVRDVNVLGIKFSEAILLASTDHIRYAIIGQWPLKNHQGDIYFSTSASGQTLVRYTITCEGPFWLPDGLIALILRQGIEKGLLKLAQHFS